MSVQTITIHVNDLDSVLAIFDQIQVFKSPDESGDPVPYAEITAAAATKATIDGTVQGPWNLTGTTLTVVLNGTDPQSIVFTGTNPLTLNQIITQVNAIFSGLAKEKPTDTNKLRLESPTSGTASSLLLSGSACAVLGLSTTKVNGKGTRIGLTNPTTEYEFRDYDGLDTDWYKTRFFSSLTGAVSSFSTPTLGNPLSVLPSGSLVRCFAFLSNGAGQPVVGRRVIAVPLTNLTLPGTSGDIYGSLPGVDRIIGITDEKGFMELFLARGQTFRFFFEGTTIQREITIPASGTELNLLTALSTAADPFSIVQAPPMPIRSS
jgi:hypothetical protein